MRLIYHPASRFDVLEIVEYYEQEAGSNLAVDFFSELLTTIDKIVRWPNSFSIFQNQLRRANLRRFPHHVLYEIIDEDTIAILVIKHDGRDPIYGLDRRM